MTTPKQVTANRRNALRSTGPRTTEGKAAIRQNALRHGMRSAESLIPGEDPGEFLEFAGDVRDRLAPRGELQGALAARIVNLAWRLRRISRAEAAIFTAYLSEIGAEHSGGMRKDEIARKTAADGSAIPGEPPPPFGMALLRDARGANALGKVARYEIGLERSLYATLRELRGLQSDRGHKVVS